MNMAKQIKDTNPETEEQIKLVKDKIRLDLA